MVLFSKKTGDNKVELIKKEFKDNTKISRIVIDNFTFSQLKINASHLYEIISELLINKENLFYYCTQRNSCRTLKGTKKYVNRLIKKGILKEELDTIFINLKWDNKSRNIDATKFSGDLCEYLMNIVIEKFSISKTLISKISLKTSPSMPSFGNDNIFYDYNSNILYFGEAKFYNNTKKALTDSFNSICEHAKNNIEISYIRNHSSTFIAEDGRSLKRIVKRLETVDISKIKIDSITFVMADDKYEEDEFINDLTDLSKESDNKYRYVNESLIVFLPIISKKDFLNYFERKLKVL